MTDLSLRDRNLRFALLKAVADAINEELSLERGDHTQELRDQYDDSGVKSFDVKLPGGGKVATISLSIPKPSTEVVDEKALLDWCQEHMPTAIQEHTVAAQPEQVIPAIPEHTVYTLDDALVGALLKGTRPVDPAGGPVVDEDGTVVEGVEYRPAGRPKSFSVRYEQTGREDLAVAYRSGELDHLVAGSSLPQLEAVQAIPMEPAEPEATWMGVPVCEVDAHAERIGWAAGDGSADYDWGIGTHVGGCDETSHLLVAQGSEPLLFEGDGA